MNYLLDYYNEIQKGNIVVGKELFTVIESLMKGEELVLETPTQFEKDFLGWFTDPELTNEFSGSIALEDLTLYAKWDIASFTISFDVAGGEAMEPVRVEIGNKLAEPANPIKHNHDFLGWYTDSEFTNEYDFETVVTNSFTLYAKWFRFIEPDLLLVDLNLVADAGEVVEVGGTKYRVGETAFSSLTAALGQLEEGYTLTLRGGTYDEAFALTTPNILVQGLDGEQAIITKRITINNTNGITLKNLEFTELGQIFANTPIDDFVFDSNKVYDITIPASEYLPANRTDVNAFIQIYTFSGSNQAGNITITNNVINGITSDVISLDRTSAGKEINISDNEFRNFGVGVVRFDGGYNSGTYRINRNIFENDVLGGSAAIVFRAYSASAGNTQTIYIEDNFFKNIGDVDNQEPADTHPRSAVINSSTFNEFDTSFYIRNNIFENNVNNIHLRNNGGNSSNWSAEINYNQFKATTGYVYYEEVDLANLNLNYYEDNDGNAITDLEVLASLIVVNTNYSELYDPNDSE